MGAFLGTHFVYGSGGAANHSSLNLQKSYFADAVELANSMARVHETYSNEEFWPGARPELCSVPAAVRYRDVMQELNAVYRSSCALTAMEKGIDPLREAISEIGPHIETAAKDRNTQLIDFDSYRRRLKGLREKREYLETQGKTNTSAGQENLAEIAKFETKEHVAKELYEQKNEALKNDILESRARYDSLMNELLVSVVVSQAELFRAAAQKLDEVIALLPQDKVEEARASIFKIVGEGGVKYSKEEKTKLQKGMMIFTGKALPSDFKKDKDASATDGTSTAPAAGATPTPKGRSASMISLPTSKSPSTPSAGNSNPFAADGQPFTADDIPKKATNPPVAAVATPPPPPPPSAPADKKVTVVALYDHEAEADDELNFKTGDVVEVLETSDDGWWKGRCHGKVGLFPVNYVEAQP